jgi:hypothetical protein
MYTLEYEADYTVFDTTIIKRDTFKSFEDLLAYARRSSEVLDGKAVIIDDEATNEYSRKQKLKKFISNAS